MCNYELWQLVFCSRTEILVISITIAVYIIINVHLFHISFWSTLLVHVILLGSVDHMMRTHRIADPHECSNLVGNISQRNTESSML